MALDTQDPSVLNGFPDLYHHPQPAAPWGPGVEFQAPLDEERLMEPRGCQQPLCSLVKAEFLALTSMLSQLLEKQRKLICVNDRTEILAG